MQLKKEAGHKNSAKKGEGKKRCQQKKKFKKMPAKKQGRALTCDGPQGRRNKGSDITCAGHVRGKGRELIGVGPRWRQHKDVDITCTGP